MTDPFPPRRPLSEAEIAERFRRVYELLLQAGRRAQQHRAAQGQQPPLHLVPPTDDAVCAASPEPPCPESGP